MHGGQWKWNFLGEMTSHECQVFFYLHTTGASVMPGFGEILEGAFEK